MTSQNLTPTQGNTGPTEKQIAGVMILKRGLYLRLRVTTVKRNAKVLLFPRVSHSMVSSQWLKLAHLKDIVASTQQIVGFEDPLFATGCCILEFQGDGDTTFSVATQVVDTIQEGIDIILGFPFEQSTIFSPTLWEGNKIHVNIKERKQAGFHVTMEGTLLPKQAFRLPFRLPATERQASNQ